MRKGLCKACITLQAASRLEYKDKDRIASQCRCNWMHLVFAAETKEYMCLLALGSEGRELLSYWQQHSVPTCPIVLDLLVSFLFFVSALASFEQ